MFDIATLLKRLATLTDTRSTKGLCYSLAPVLLLIILAKLSGEDRHTRALLQLLQMALSGTALIPRSRSGPPVKAHRWKH